jgi:hypothetical protein
MPIAPEVFTLERGGKAEEGKEGIELIAEVHQITLTSGAGAPSGDTSTQDEAAHAPGSEQLIVMNDTSTGEGLVVHLWKDRVSYDAWAGRRQALTAQQEGAGTKIDSGHLYEVSFRS